MFLLKTLGALSAMPFLIEKLAIALLAHVVKIASAAITLRGTLPAALLRRQVCTQSWTRRPCFSLLQTSRQRISGVLQTCSSPQDPIAHQSILTLLLPPLTALAFPLSLLSAAVPRLRSMSSTNGATSTQLPIVNLTE